MNHFDPALLRELIALLQSGQIEDAELEAKWILEDAGSAAQARDIAQHRAKHEPLQYLLGKCEYINREQDLGIPGLRQAKQSYMPDRMLKDHLLIPR